jgi:hypothetical protein
MLFHVLRRQDFNMLISLLIPVQKMQLPQEPDLAPAKAPLSHGFVRSGLISIAQ